MESTTTAYEVSTQLETQTELPESDGGMPLEEMKGAPTRRNRRLTPHVTDPARWRPLAADQVEHRWNMVVGRNIESVANQRNFPWCYRSAVTAWVYAPDGNVAHAQLGWFDSPSAVFDLRDLLLVAVAIPERGRAVATMSRVGTHRTPSGGVALHAVYRGGWNLLAPPGTRGGFTAVPEAGIAGVVLDLADMLVGSWVYDPRDEGSPFATVSRDPVAAGDLTAFVECPPWRTPASLVPLLESNPPQAILLPNQTGYYVKAAKLPGDVQAARYSLEWQADRPWGNNAVMAWINQVRAMPVPGLLGWTFGRLTPGTGRAMIAELPGVPAGVAV